MATWTNVANTSLEPGSPARSVDAFALRDNPIAIAEGAAGAPRIAGQQGPAVQTAGLFDGAVTNNKLQTPIAGTNHLIMRLQEAPVGNTNTSYFPTGHNNRSNTGAHLGVTCLVAGTITAFLQHRRTGSGTAFVRILKNEALIQEWSSTSTAFTTRQVNISVAVGDVIIIQWRSSADTALSETRQLRIYSNNPNFAVA
jgi:hypothetical protein